MKFFPGSILLIVLAISISGCAILVETGGVQKYNKANFSVDLPEGWMRNNRGRFLVMSKDGFPCQLIVADRRSLDKNMKDMPKQFSEDMLPHEQAETYLDAMKMSKSKLNFTVEENSPAKISGKPGFKVVYWFNYEDGPKIKCMSYGLIHDKHFYLIRYEAPARHYYDKDVEAFEKIVRSYQILK